MSGTGEESGPSSFASLAAGAEHTASRYGGPRGDESRPFNWAGAGLFAARAARPPAQGQEQERALSPDDQEEHEEGEEDNTRLRFKPAIPLPDLIEVITGEEDWMEIYSKRAKLFRFDQANEEWKERGVGKMKILYNEDKGQYRLVMRREKVLKVVCNHLLTPDLCLRPQLTSENAWCWHVINFSESSSGSSEILAVKFTSKTAAMEFKERVDRCIQQICTYMDTTG